ncbi:hypothetical protein [Pseudomonas asiatica]|uniref:Uncharacterized protein n=1 Tax=Pseudomonas asiatica TaxID=2219225 RepID=A0A9X4CZC4_9PSED|nr:hypothetical protein [Pseudomonas asiatica]MDD2106818.1 hypothetical protein [Pseudomonas asiatica]
MMDRVYPHMGWLAMDQAVDYLHHLGLPEITERAFWQLCKIGKCRVYLDCCNREGWLHTSSDGETPIYDDVVGDGYCQIIFPPDQVFNRTNYTDVSGPMVFRNRLINDQEWVLKAPYDISEARFKPIDIEALAGLVADTGERGQIIKLNELSDVNYAAKLEVLASSNNTEIEQQSISDAALGAKVRRQRQDFAIRPREDRDAREAEYRRWLTAAEEIRQESSRPRSKRELAQLVKERLHLPDSLETVRKRL